MLPQRRSTRTAVLLLLAFSSAAFAADGTALQVHPTMTRGMQSRTLSAPIGQIPRTPPLPDTLRLLAIRVEFATDTLSTTTGDGTFWQSIPAGREEEDWTIDVPPHDANYFERQLAAVRRYFERHSGGKLTITGNLASGPNDGGDLFPAADVAAYTLPYPIWHINYGNDDDERLNQTLTQLFVDAWELAGADPAVDVSNYDLFVVFHAGAGNEFDTGYDTTPHDIPSVFIGPEDLATYASLPSGVVLSSGTITQGVILPETQRQEEIEVGLLGTLVHQIGYLIGMPHLYDTQTGDPGVGMFGVMDRGFGGFFGLIPTPPHAWTRAYMGWDSVTVVQQGDITLGAYGLPQSNFGPNLSQLVKVPINSSEYYLLEARLRDPNEDSLAVGWDLDGDTIRFKEDYSWETDPNFDVLYDVDDPDFDLPASGILIWHIDKSVIAAKLADDALQTDKTHRAVDLEEADGSEDIGEEYEFLTAGDGSEYGIREDAFYRSNELWRDANGANNVEFGPFTHPSTTTYNGGESWLTFGEFSAIDDTMHAIVVNTLKFGDFPEELDWVEGDVDISFADMNGDDTLELVLWDETGRVAAYNYDGTPYDTTDTLLVDLTDSNVMLRVIPGDTAKLLLVGDDAAGVYSHDGSTLSGGLVTMTMGTPLAAVTNADWYAVLKDSSNALLLNQSGERLPNGMGFYRHPLADTISGMPPQLIRPGLADCDTLAILYGDFGYAVFWNHGGGTAGFSFSNDEYDASLCGKAVAADFDGDGRFDIGYGASDHKQYFAPSIVPRLNVSPYDPVTVDAVNGVMLPLDSDGDGLPEYGYLGQNRELISLERLGLISEGSPVTLSARLGQPTFQDALIADVDGLGVPDIIAYSYLGDGKAAISAYNSADGTALRGFPLDFGYTASQEPPALGIADLDLDGDLELATVTRGGTSGTTLRVWDLPRSSQGTPNVFWGLADGDPTGGRSYPFASNATAISGPDGMSNAYAWPNPASGDEVHFRFPAPEYGTATLVIYDFVSREVYRDEASLLVGGENEFTVSVADWPSGVYVARIATGGEKTLVRFAVMH